MTLESSIEMPVVFRAKRAGYFVRKVAWVGKRSAPDRIFARKDRGQVYVEFKAPGKAPTRLQIEEHKLMRAAGFEVHVIDSVEEGLRVLWLTPGSNMPPGDGMEMV